MQQTVLTVSQLTYQIKSMLETSPILKGFTLKGEISNFTHHRTGHLYFSLKDENSQIRAIMFQGNASRLLFKPKDGDKVTITGNITLYAPQGSYSVQVTSMNLDGAGELYLKYLELKEKLKTLGWFDKEKKEIPKYPKTIGVVTSPTGAVIEDIKNTVNRRYRLTNILLYPALVQGPGSSESISRQIKKANDDNIADILIVGRGGGSIEDLWGFNELATISAIYNSNIPVITAIGHETDSTISDLVSDLRAPTPTAAAEISTPSTNVLIESLKEMYLNIKFKTQNLINNHQTTLIHLTDRLEKSGPLKRFNEYKNNLSNHERFLNNLYVQKLNKAKNRLNELEIKLNNLSPNNKILNIKKDLNQIKVNLTKSYNYILERDKAKLINYESSINKSYRDLLITKDSKLNNITEILKRVNPLNIMDRGFTITKDSKGKILSSVKTLEKDDNIQVTFKDGYIDALILNKKENE